MLIRSQDKRKLSNLNLVSDIVVSKTKSGNAEVLACYPYFATSDCGFATLGTYSTEEKAINVLGMIQNKYFEHMTVESNGAVVQILERPKVFQMPSDEEVPND